jgi:N-acyl-D-amino-acid deacylase
MMLLRGGTIVDGTGNDRFEADLRIDRDRIDAIGPNLDPGDADVVDVSGKIVAPGFIDVHPHDDQAVLAAPAMMA